MQKQNIKTYKNVSPFIMELIRIQVIRHKRRIKNRKYRKCIMDEWKTTEENYLRDLRKIKELKQEILQSQLISKEQSLILFSNLEEILKLNSSFCEVLKALTTSFDPKNSIISNQLLMFCPFFKIYYQYCENFNQSIALFQLLKQNKKLKKIIESKEGTPQFEGLTLQSLLIKPVQRLLKYVLFLETYLKHMQKKDVDYEGIVKCIEEFRNVNCHNNQMMEEEVRNKKFREIQLVYKNILQAGRKYLDFKTRFIQLKSFKKYNIFFFNDMILLVNSQNELNDYFTMQLDYNSYVYQIPSGKYFCNWIFVSGKSNSISLKTVSIQQRNNTLELLSNIISNLQQNIQNRKKIYYKHLNQMFEQKPFQSKIPKLIYRDFSLNQDDKTSFKKRFFEKLQIYCIASEKWPISFLIDQTWYIVEMRIYDQRIRKKFSIEQIERFNKYLHLNYQNKLISNLNLKSNHISVYNEWKNKSQIMEFRKLAIQEYLSNLIKEVIFYEDEYLYSYLLGNFLKIPSFFRKFAENTKESKPFQSLIESQKKKKKITAEFDYSNKIQSENILEFMYLQNGIIYKNFQEKNSSKNLTIVINSHLSQKICQRYVINENLTVHDLLIQIAKERKLIEYRDFSIEYSLCEQRRLLDFDEILSEFFQKQQEQKQNSSFSQKLKKKINSISEWSYELITGKTANFFLKKTIFLPQFFEYSLIEKQLKEEMPKRILLIFQQYVCRFQKGYYNNLFLENIQKLCEICAIYKFFKDEVTNQNLIVSKRVKELFHIGIFQRQTQQKWKESVTTYVQDIKNEYKNKPKLKELLLRAIKIIGPLTFGIIQGKEKNKRIFLFYYHDCVKIFSQQFEILIKLNYSEFEIRCCPKSIYLDFNREGGKEFVRIDVQFPLNQSDRLKWQQQIFLKFFFNRQNQNGYYNDQYVSQSTTQ